MYLSLDAPPSPHYGAGNERGRGGRGEGGVRAKETYPKGPPTSGLFGFRPPCCPLLMHLREVPSREGCRLLSPAPTYGPAQAIMSACAKMTAARQLAHLLGKGLRCTRYHGKGDTERCYPSISSAPASMITCHGTICNLRATDQSPLVVFTPSGNLITRAQTVPFKLPPARLTVQLQLAQSKPSTALECLASLFGRDRDARDC